MNKVQIKTTLAAYQAARNERLKLDQASAKLKVQEDSLLDQLTAAGVSSGQYGPYLLEATKKPVPRCTDWPGFYTYLRETGNLEMLHKRLTESALIERRNANEYVPGIVFDDKVVYKISAA